MRWKYAHFMWTLLLFVILKMKNGNVFKCCIADWRRIFLVLPIGIHLFSNLCMDCEQFDHHHSWVTQPMRKKKVKVAMINFNHNVPPLPVVVLQQNPYTNHFPITCHSRNLDLAPGSRIGKLVDHLKSAHSHKLIKGFKVIEVDETLASATVFENRFFKKKLFWKQTIFKNKF